MQGQRNTGRIYPMEWHQSTMDWPISMDQCKTAVSPLLTHWRYCTKPKQIKSKSQPYPYAIMYVHRTLVSNLKKNLKDDTTVTTHTISVTKHERVSNYQKFDYLFNRENIMAPYTGYLWGGTTGHWWMLSPRDSPQKEPVMRKPFPYQGVIVKN